MKFLFTDLDRLGIQNTVNILILFDFINWYTIRKNRHNVYRTDCLQRKIHILNKNALSEIWRFYNLSGQSALMLDYHHSKKSFPYMQPEHLLFQLESVDPHPPILHHCKEPISISLITPQRCWGSVRCPQSHPFSRLTQPSSPSLSSWDKCSSPSTFRALPWGPSSLSVSFLCWSPKLDVVSRCGLTSVTYQGIIPSFDLQAVPLSIHPRSCWAPLLPAHSKGSCSASCPPPPQDLSHRATPQPLCSTASQCRGSALPGTALCFCCICL